METITMGYIGSSSLFASCIELKVRDSEGVYTWLLIQNGLCTDGGLEILTRLQ